MMVLLREESDGVVTTLSESGSFVPLMKAISRGGEYERGQRLEIAIEYLSSDNLPLAVWTPETGWEATAYADWKVGDGVLLLSHLMLHEVTERIYTETDSFEPMALDLCYLLAAIAKGTTVEWEDSQDEGGRYTNVVKLCRELFPEGHSLWNHIDIQ